MRSVLRTVQDYLFQRTRLSRSLLLLAVLSACIFSSLGLASRYAFERYAMQADRNWGLEKSGLHLELRDGTERPELEGLDFPEGLSILAPEAETGLLWIYDPLMHYYDLQGQVSLGVQRYFSPRDYRERRAVGLAILGMEEAFEFREKNPPPLELEQSYSLLGLFQREYLEELDPGGTSETRPWRAALNLTARRNLPPELYIYVEELGSRAAILRYFEALGYRDLDSGPGFVLPQLWMAMLSNAKSLSLALPAILLYFFACFSLLAFHGRMGQIYRQHILWGASFRSLLKRLLPGFLIWQALGMLLLPFLLFSLGGLPQLPHWWDLFAQLYCLHLALVTGLYVLFLFLRVHYLRKGGRLYVRY